MFKKVLKSHWPVFILIGYFIGLGLEIILPQLGIESLEIHYRLFAVIALSVLTFGGLLLTMFPKVYVVIFIIIISILHYGFRLKNGDRK